MPGAGKSTVTRLVAEQLPRSARLGGDEFNQLIVNGFVFALGEPADEAARQVELLHRNLCAVANNFIDAGFTPLIDAMVASRERLDFFLDLLAPREVLFIILAPGPDTCRHRNKTRNPADHFDFDNYETLESTMKHAFGHLGWWLDTSSQTPTQTATQILTEAPHRARVN
ncbi:AAA family ATPase [Kribbella sp. NPDC051586]|uniref:AAA family ATPase n=1 Tax=Kribbella sp. NPDC051586 TaxID=3364118 RepID=UPI00379C1408